MLFLTPNQQCQRTEGWASYYYYEQNCVQEFVGDAARDAYAMSHLSAVNLACTYVLAGCRLTRGTLTAGRGTSIGLQRVNDDLSAQPDKPRWV